jgi:hypothetical protein
MSEDSNKTGDAVALAKEMLDLKRSEHEKLRNSKPYTDEIKHLTRLTHDFLFCIHSCWLAFTRYPDGRHWLLQGATDQLVESAIALPALVEQGIFGAARRELRFMLEAVTKYVLVDQSVSGSTPVAARVKYLHENVRRSSIDPIEDVKLRLVTDTVGFKNDVKSQFGDLSAYVHPSQDQIGDLFSRIDRGEGPGFEGPADIRRLNAQTSKVLDIVLALYFEGIGPSFTGDVFVHVLDDLENWKFRRTKYVSQIDRFFDYKHERKPDSTAG